MYRLAFGVKRFERRSSDRLFSVKGMTFRLSRSKGLDRAETGEGVFAYFKCNGLAEKNKIIMKFLLGR